MNSENTCLVACANVIKTNDFYFCAVAKKSNLAKKIDKNDVIPTICIKKKYFKKKREDENSLFTF